MKSVLISIRPQWVEKIASGEKTIEVRKTAPQEVPFKCYIYETKGQYVKFSHGGHTKYGYGRGKVIGEFICDKVYMSLVGYMKNEPCYWDILNGSCLTKDEIMNYGKWKTLYGWHISDLKIYDKPKELSEFRKPCPYGDLPCWICPSCDKDENDNLIQCFNTVSRPPQSWQYIEDLGEKE